MTVHAQIGLLSASSRVRTPAAAWLQHEQAELVLQLGVANKCSHTVAYIVMSLVGSSKKCLDIVRVHLGAVALNKGLHLAPKRTAPTKHCTSTTAAALLSLMWSYEMAHAGGAQQTSATNGCANQALAVLESAACGVGIHRSNPVCSKGASAGLPLLSPRFRR